MRYAISAVPGHEAETAGATPVDGAERWDAELEVKYEVAAYIEAATPEVAYEAALAHYGLA